MAEARPEIDESIVKCPICFEVFTKPKSLPCLHTFCLECLSTYITKCVSGDGVQSSGFPCPICRATTIPPKTTENPATWAEQFPTNSIIMHVLELTNFRNKDRYCDPCKERSKEKIQAEKWCKNCTAYLCKDCLEFHNSFLKGHILSPAESAVTNAANVIENLSTMCEEHEEKVDMFCCDHQHLACAKCIAIDHRRCEKVVTTKAFARELQTTDEINKIDKQLESRLIEISEISDKKKQKLKNLGNEKERFRNEIVGTVNDILNTFKKIGENNTNNLEAMYKEDVDAIQKELEQCEIIKQSVEYSRKIMQTAGVCGGSDQIVSTVLKSKSENEKLENTLSELKGNEKEEVLYQFDNVLPLNRLKKDAMSIKEELKMNRLIPNIDTGTCKAVQVHSFSAKLESDKRTCRITGVLLTGRRIILCDSDNSKLKLFDKTGKCLSELSMKDGYKPFDLCLLTPDKILISLAPKGMKELAVVGINGDNLKLLSSIYTDDNCTGVGFVDDHIFVTCPYAEPPHVAILYEYGHTLQQIDNCQTTRFAGNIWHLALNKNTEDLIVTRRITNVLRLFIFKYDGTSRNVIDVSEASGGRGVDVDHQGYIYVCAINSSVIIQISPDGTTNRVMLSASDGLSQPAAISIDGNTFVVTEDGGDNAETVKIFAMKP